MKTIFNCLLLIVYMNILSCASQEQVNQTRIDKGYPVLNDTTNIVVQDTTKIKYLKTKEKYFDCSQ